VVFNSDKLDRIFLAYVVHAYFLILAYVVHAKIALLS